ncbi:TIGR01440 family protein [Alicyclobacillus herbarius]|uniref:TIGR01440 family protein n=1 Tax=Alicyclobacillus herbarius TaxID=122960 RepID=UPI003B5CEE6C
MAVTEDRIGYTGSGLPPLDPETMGAELAACLEDLFAAADLGPGKLLVVGASTSEVAGQRIGTATSLDVGRVLVETVMAKTAAVGCAVAFQCCEHLNRALVVTREMAMQRGYREVMAIPVPGAGGAAAAVAFAEMADACLVEAVAADAGIDIGDTFIGMHLKPVVVPVRPRRPLVGRAHVTMARTRPPLIGGARAVYDPTEARERLGG